MYIPLLICSMTAFFVLIAGIAAVIIRNRYFRAFRAERSADILHQPYNIENMALSRDPVVLHLQKHTHYAICHMGIQVFTQIWEKGMVPVPEDFFTELVRQHDSQALVIPATDRGGLPANMTATLIRKTGDLATEILGRDVVEGLKRKNITIVSRTFFLELLKKRHSRAFRILSRKPYEINPLR